MKDELMVKEELKECNKCGEMKPLSEFYKKKVGGWSGYFAQCKQCVRNKQRERYNTPEYRKKNRERMRGAYREYISNWKKQNPTIENVEESEKRRARVDVQNAIDRGDLKRPNNCENCGVECKPQAHHKDYSSTLDVVWLCTKCHSIVHHVDF